MVECQVGNTFRSRRTSGARGMYCVFAGLLTMFILYVVYLFSEVSEAGSELLGTYTAPFWGGDTPQCE